MKTMEHHGTDYTMIAIIILYFISHFLQMWLR